MEGARSPQYDPAEARFAAGAAAALLLLSGVISLPTLRFRLYAEVYEYLPYQVMLLRYAVSCAIRAAAIAAGLGLLARREWARRLAIGLELFTLATLWWKHPAAGIARATVDAAREFPPGFLDDFRWFLYALDGLLAVAVLYALTRPKVRERFARS
ncbi:MAG: hypothetical protein M0D55_15750 [Elusimicrobiota bacterium]|nr:MAG: hypothetical protein M0D55_15750 [Elusimicrobiota bacterium]